MTAEQATHRRPAALGVAAAVAILAGALGPGPATAAPGQRMAISPAPGTPAASPETHSRSRCSPESHPVRQGDR
jgi:hypothetical protein